MARRVPQITDDIELSLILPPTTEEWAEELMAKFEMDDVHRSDFALVIKTVVGGNTNALSVAQDFLHDLEDAFRDGDVDPMEFTLTVTAKEPT